MLRILNLRITRAHPNSLSMALTETDEIDILTGVAGTFLGV